MSPSPALAVVVPVRDGAAVVGGLLDALADQDVPPAQVVVVDDASRDRTAEVVMAHPIGARLVRGPGRGSYAARNAGIAALADGVGAVAFTDVDCRPEPGWSAALQASLSDGADLVGGRVVQALSASPTVAERYDAAIYLDQAELVEHAGFAATANLTVRRGVLDELGGFDATLRSSGDLELCRRARSAGFRLVYEHDAVVRHQPRRSTRELWRLHRRLGAGWGVLARRDGGPPVHRDERLRLALGTVVERVARQGPPLRRRHLLGPHVVVLGARVLGRVTGR